MKQPLIEKYVAGRMGEDEAAAFELSCLKDPELARQVEFEQRLKAGLGEVARGSTAEFVRSDPGLGWRVAVAASVLLVVFAAVLLWQRYVITRPPILASVPAGLHAKTASLRLALVRGTEDRPRLPTGPVRVEIAGMFDPGYHYSVVVDRLREQHLDNVATLFGLTPASPLALEVLIDGDQLSDGVYSLRVRKQASNEEPLDFIFEKP